MAGTLVWPGDSGAWTSENIACYEALGTGNDRYLAFDSSNEAHHIYGTGHRFAPGSARLHYASRQADRWETEIVDAGEMAFWEPI